MLNERTEISSILSGKAVEKYRMYRCCYLLGKYHKQLGLNTVKSREEINKWLQLQKNPLGADLNMIITKAFADKKPLVEDVKVYISKKDINEINRRFDRKKTKLLAFALLSYAKLHANSDGIMDVSMRDIAKWTGIPRTDFYRNYGYMSELEDFEYIVKLDDNVHTTKKTGRNSLKQKTKLRICVDFSNKGEFMFTDKNLHEEFETIMRLA